MNGQARAAAIVISILTLGALMGCSDQQTNPADNNLDTTNVNAMVQQIVQGSDDTTPHLTTQAIGDPLPDLVVSSDRLRNSYRFATEIFASNNCTVTEGRFAAGTYHTLRFDAVMLNIGNQDLEIGDPRFKVDPNHDGNPIDGLFEYAPCHQHYHFRHTALYELIPAAGGTPVRARKIGFCMIDNYLGTYGSTRRFPNCANQGISRGWGDIYVSALPGQFFLLNEPGNTLAPGSYKLRVTANPPYTPAAGEICPARMTDNTCRMFKESNYNNNTGEININISASDIGTTSTTPPDNGAPCSHCDQYTVTLSQGQDQYVPEAGFSSGARTLRAWLKGPAGTDFDLYLYRWTGSSWTYITRSASYTSEEYVSYDVPANGQYRWMVRAWKGNGSYKLWLE